MLIIFICQENGQTGGRGPGAEEATGMDVKQSVERSFGAVAANYAVSPVHRSGRDLDAMVAAAACSGGERALDLGCGPGHAALALAPRVAELVAVDLSEAMLEQARRLATERGVANARFERADAESLPFPDASFDVVTSRHCAHHFPHPEAALRETARVLRPGGRFLLMDSVASEEPAADTYLNAIEVLRDPTHVRDHTLSQWRALFARAGLAAEVLDTWPLELDVASWVARTRTPPESVAGIRALFGAAPEEVQRCLAVDGREASRFQLRIALLRGRVAIA
jgi:ubiquinone/menaquinone biosynthesis C-methylase UbiE